MLMHFFLIREWSLTQVSKKCKMIKYLLRPLLRTQPVCRMGRSSEMKLEMMPHHHSIASYFSHRHQTTFWTQTKIAQSSLFTALKSFTCVCFFGHGHDVRANMPHACMPSYLHVLICFYLDESCRHASTQSSNHVETYLILYFYHKANIFISM